MELEKSIECSHKVDPKNTQKIRKFDYLIVNTGYTARLFEKIQYIREEIEERDMCTEDDNPVLFCYDSIWGDEKPILACNNKDENYKELLNLCISNKLDGTICFKVEDFNIQKAMCICEILMELEYCAMFHFTNLTKIEILNISGKKVCIMYFDCESG